MIKIIDSGFSLFDEFKNYCKISSFGTRIYSHFLCYGYEYDFALFWVQIIDDKVTCAICKLDGDFVLCVCDDTDFEELVSFLNFQDKCSVTFDNKYYGHLCFDSGIVSVGDVLVYGGNADISSDFDIITPELKEYHNLLLTCESEDFFVPEYMHFLSDVSRRQMRGMCSVFGIKVVDTLVSCAMTVSYTDFSVILGAVATHPQHRKHGYAGCVVSALANKFKDIGNVYIYTTIEKNTRFYEKLSFTVCGRWVKFTFGG